MKIVCQQSHRPTTVPVKDIAAGEVVRFLKSFYQEHCSSDRWLVLDVPSDYTPHKRKRTSGYDYHDCSKVGLANLNTGKLSYVKGDRECVEVNAELLDSGDAL